MAICENCESEHNGIYGTGRFCSAKCARGFSTKAKRDEINKKVSEKTRNTVFVQGTRVNISTKLCKKCNLVEVKRTQKYCDECRPIALSENISKKNKGKTGGHREKSGRGICGNYEGFFFQSSWELAWIIFSLDHGKIFTRNNEKFSYVYGNKTYKYVPDFILDNGEYVEVKGYWTDKWQSKMDQFPYKLIVIGKQEIVPFINYAKQKYGDKFFERFKY